MRLFLQTMKPRSTSRVVDVGVADTGFQTEGGVAATQNFFEVMYPWPHRITAVSDVPLPNFQRVFPNIRCVVADGRDLPFADREFDIAFSNAVVEHVGDRDAQRQFVAELCRIAGAVFISTPNRWSPVETHTLLPLVHWLPRRVRDRAFAMLGQREWQSLELLGGRDLVALFSPEVEARVVERGLTVSVAARRR
jgi:SAM-dependent methyltransferase